MFSHQVMQLMKINLLYINPQQTRRARESGKTGRALYLSIIQTYLLIGGGFILIFGASLLGANLVKNSGSFTSIVALFTLIGLAQSITIIDNVFFESQDLKDYLPLPLKQWAIYISKFAVVALTILPMMIPVWLAFVMTGIQTGRFIGIGFTVGTLLFLLYYGFLFAICSVLIFLFAQTRLYRHHQKLMTFMMTGISMVTGVAAIVMIDSSNMDTGSQHTLPGFIQLHDTMVNPASGTGLLTIGTLVVGIAVLGFLMQRWLLPKVMQGANTQSTHKARRHHRHGSSTRQLIRYNFGLLENPTLLTQSLAMTIFPVAILIVILLTVQRLTLAGLSIRYAGVVFVAGVFIAAITMNTSSLSGVMISLERQNLDFIKALPIDFNRYLWLKFRLVAGLQFAILLVLGLLFGFFAKLSWVNTLALILGFGLGNGLVTLFNFTRDWRLLDLTWTNVTQLFNRGGGNLGVSLIFTGVMIVGIIAVTSYYLALAAISPLIVNIVVLLFLVVLSVIFIEVHVSYWRRNR